ncbi:TPA: phage tail protein [Klebsiella pneumoniae subsp. pneumoniae]|uniref:phage tail protein n=1 Tax=Klebsiella pneumoniae TaxID=573 RepID=UPI001E332404|nr:phage tail protein [Klebsiella pneumoniae]HDS2510467.1 phage tail protein [Klebsiella pneumoniae subsp. pneumoniae]MCC4997777.1 phage tail protein [Klebsiella pneumoniae]HDS2531669.1 phage tail protein [Klebsiella pneumoniae subsp. pneumoniae]HDS2542088.1 phage tail protein [Klebsiella pneumoniae subsp. pneumoniae]HDS2552290.1 phage tail protein [Klebsiella pneumoniae subsp. pneumoniae]
MKMSFCTYLTPAGVEKFAAAALTGKPVRFTEMAVGDGGGEQPDPEGRTGLINELYRAPLNRVVIADQSASVIRAEMIMLPQIGGFWLREAALYDDEGECLAVASVPPSYKPMLAQGSGRLQAVNLWIMVSNTASVTLKTDPTVIIASVDEVNRAKSEAKDYADEVVGQLGNDIQKAIAEAIKTAVRDAWEEDNPPGTTRFFNQNLNPNERWPWSQWVYTGENKTIRVAKADGSNVGNTGGSDTVTIQQANLPAVQVNVSGETSELPGQELTTREAGRHKHKGGMLAPGEVWDDNYIVGSDNDSRRTRNYTDEVADHSHIVALPAHKHTTTGKTDNLGEGKSISVVEAHTLLMCWSRVA